MSKIIGIDLGTTNSCVAVIENNKPVVIINAEGWPTTPSMVAFTDNGNGERKVGESAKRQSALNPKHTVYSIKRFMGRMFDEVSEELKNVPYQVVRGANNTPRVEIGDRQYTPQEISAMILQKMKRTAEEYLGHEVKEAVITVPAYFNDAQRQATIEAGEIAGLVVKRIVNEPTAAALAFGLDKQDKDLRIAVYDLGGGTFDISILELGGGVFEVKSTNGDTHLGGDDFDKVLIDWMAGEFMKEFPTVDPRKDAMAFQRLRDEAEKAKKELSSTTQYQVMIPYFFPVDGIARNLVCSISRAKFEQLCEHLVERTLEPCRKALKDAGVNPSDIDEVILVGGSTRIPRIQQAVEQFFGKKPNKTINPDEAVALGAAVQGGILNKDIQGVVLLDVTPLSLGIETVGGMMTKIIESQTTIPVTKSEVFTTAADNQSSVEIHILQGERPLAIQNRTIGRFHLEGIPPAHRGTPKIRVKFDLDANGVLNVTATDEGTGKEQKIRIEASSGLSKEEIERMKSDAKSNESEDKRIREEAEKLNQADNLIYSTEKQLKEYGDKLSEANKTAIEAALKELVEAHKIRNIAEIDAATAKLNQAWSQASTEMYNATQNQQGEQNQQQNQQHTQSNTNNNPNDKDSNVTDADYEEIK